MATAGQTSSPLPTEELMQIAANACEIAVGTAEKYEHTQVGDWNTLIINTILQSLIEKTTPDHKNSQPAWKYIVNSTIIQHQFDPANPKAGGRRGMHSAVGAFWNNERDGTYSYKWEVAVEKGMDIVISINWIHI